MLFVRAFLTGGREESKMHMQQHTYLFLRGELSNKLFDYQGLSQFFIKQKKRKISVV